jgi:hypothetical protein
MGEIPRAHEEDKEVSKEERKSDMISKENDPYRADRLVWYRSLTFFVGLLSLAESVRSWVKLPDALRYYFLLHHSIPRGDLGWFLNLGLDWPIWEWLEVITLVGWAIGTVFIGIGLLLRRKRTIAAGLIAIAPATAKDLLLIPGRVAVMLGRAYWGKVDLSDQLVRRVLALTGSGLLLASLIGIVYFWWVWRTYRGMSVKIVEDRRPR